MGLYSIVGLYLCFLSTLKTHLVRVQPPPCGLTVGVCPEAVPGEQEDYTARTRCVLGEHLSFGSQPLKGHSKAGKVDIPNPNGW